MENLKLADDIQRLHQEGKTLQEIGEFVRDQGFHIEVAKAAFEQAGFKAEIRRPRILFLKMLWLVLRDESYIESLKEKIIELAHTDLSNYSDQNFKKELEALKEKAPNEPTALIDWKKRNH